MSRTIGDFMIEDYEPPVVNVEALRETMDAVIAANAVGQWIQSQWVCNVDLAGNECETAGCFAGWRAFLDGYRILPHSNIYDEMLFNPQTNDRLDTVANWAIKRLGLTSGEADALFWEGNSLEDLKEIVDLIAAGESVDQFLHRREEEDDRLDRIYYSELLEY